MVYHLALKQIAKQTGKTIETIMIEACDLWIQRHQYTQQDNMPVSFQSKAQPQPQIQSKTQTQTQAKAQIQKIIPICSSQLDVIPSEDSFEILLELSDGYWLDSKPYTSFENALQKINEYGTIGHIDLTQWRPMSGEYPVVILYKVGGTPHIWLGQNAACKIFNNKEMQPNSYTLTKQVPTDSICKICIKKYQSIKSPKFHATFTENNSIETEEFNNLNQLF